MKKLVAATTLSLTVNCGLAPLAFSESGAPAKQSLAMTAMPMQVAPHPVRPVPRINANAQSISTALLRKKAATAYPRTHYEKAQYFKKKGDLNAALVEFLRTTQENPRIVKAFYEQALIFRQKHFLKLAESALEQSLAVKPDDREARLLLAEIRMEQGNVGEAMAELGRSLGLQIAPPPAAKPEVAKASDRPKGPAPVEQVLSKAPSVLQSLHNMLADVPEYEIKPDSRPVSEEPSEERLPRPAVTKTLLASKLPAPASPPQTESATTGSAPESSPTPSLEPFHANQSLLKFEPAEPGEAPTFQMPKIAAATTGLLAPMTQSQASAPPEESGPPPDDEWTVRLKYLEEHGTATLKQGEAFMFSEDTGEATLFLPSGDTIRRTIATPRDRKEVVRERRPDVLAPEQIVYNLQLLGKLMQAKQPEQQAISVPPQQPPADRPNQKSAPQFDLQDIMGNSQGFWGWFKHVLKLQ